MAERDGGDAEHVILQIEREQQGEAQEQNDLPAVLGYRHVEGGDVAMTELKRVEESSGRSRGGHTRLTCDWSSDVCSSDLEIDVERRAGNDSGECRGYEMAERDGSDAEHVILQIERDQRAEAQQQHDLPAVLGYRHVEGGDVAM